MDKSEKKFKEFCEHRKWKIYDIPKLPDIKTPDFFVIADNKPFIIEVKNLSESGSDRIDIKKIVINGETVGQSGDYNKEINSIVRKIEEAHQQFRTTRSFNIPQILVINSDRQFVQLDKDIVFQAMYGKIFQRLLVRELKSNLKKHSLNLPPLIVDRTIKKDKNNLISAIGIPNGNDGMFILHNLWADITFPISIFNQENDVNYIPKEVKFKEVKFK